MRRPARVALLLSTIAALAALGPASAQTPPPPTDQSTPAPTTPPAPKRDRAVSDSLAASLAASMPKYNPPPKPRPEDEDVDLRDVDKPRNGIIRLPKYIVRERKLPELSNREMLTPDGRLDLAFKRHPGLLFGNFFNLNAGIGLAMLAEEQQIERNSEMADLAELARLADTAREPPPKNAAPPPAPVEKK